jgi:hypothetical protein
MIARDRLVREAERHGPTVSVLERAHLPCATPMTTTPSSADGRDSWRHIIFALPPSKAISGTPWAVTKVFIRRRRDGASARTMRDRMAK